MALTSLKCLGPTGWAACVAVKNVISKNIQGLFDKFFFYLLLVRH